MVEPPLIEDVFAYCTRFLRTCFHRVSSRHWRPPVELLSKLLSSYCRVYCQVAVEFPVELSRPGLKKEEEPRTYNFVIVIRLVLRRVCAAPSGVCATHTRTPAITQLYRLQSYTSPSSVVRVQAKSRRLRGKPQRSCRLKNLKLTSNCR